MVFAFVQKPNKLLITPADFRVLSICSPVRKIYIFLLDVNLVRGLMLLFKMMIKMIVLMLRMIPG